MPEIAAGSQRWRSEPAGVTLSPSVQPLPPRRRRSWPLALAASLLLHALALLWLTLRPAPPPLPPSARPLELVVVEVARPPAPPAPVKEALKKAPAPVPPPRRRAPAIAKAPAAPPAAPVAAPLVAEPPAPREPLASDVPRAAPAPDAPSRGPAGGLVLVPRNPRLELPAQPPPEAHGPRGIPEAPRPLSVQEMASNAAADVQGKVRAELGSFHPYFFELGRALLAAWHPESVVGHSERQLVAERGLSLQDATNAYLGRAKAYGSTGSGFSGLSVGAPREPTGPLDAAAYTTGYVAMSAGMSAELEKKASALVRLVQDRDGRLVSLELLKPSAHPEVDRLALDDLRAAGLRLPVPPPEALGPRTRLVSTWELAVRPSAETDGDHSSRTFVASLVGLGWNKRVRLLSGL